MSNTSSCSSQLFSNWKKCMDKKYACKHGNLVGDDDADGHMHA